MLLVCNQNIRFVFCDFRREAEIAKNKTGPSPNGFGPKEKALDFGVPNPSWVRIQKKGRFREAGWAGFGA